MKLATEISRGALVDPLLNLPHMQCTIVQRSHGSAKLLAIPIIMKSSSSKIVQRGIQYLKNAPFVKFPTLKNFEHLFLVDISITQTDRC